MAAIHIHISTSYLQSEPHANNTNLIFTSYDAYVTSELTSLLSRSLLEVHS